MRDLWATCFWDFIFLPLDSTSKNTYSCQFSRRGDRSLTAKSGQEGPKEVGQKSAREFELFLAQPLCWPMQNQGVLIYCRENMSAPSHVHFNTFFCTVSTFVLWTIWILARFLSHFFGTFVPRFDWERPVASSWKLAWVSIFGRRIRWKKNQVPETGLSQVSPRSLPWSLRISLPLWPLLPHLISPVRPENLHGVRWSVEENSLKKSSKTIHFYYLISKISFF